VSRVRLMLSSHCLYTHSHPYSDEESTVRLHGDEEISTPTSQHSRQGAHLTHAGVETGRVGGKSTRLDKLMIIVATRSECTRACPL
jgi:hypothetical protein